MSSHINYVILAATLVQYLMAIAGASLTVLALVIAFDSNPNNTTMHPRLISSLLVAVIASFIGTHLMADVSALESSNPAMAGQSTGLRYFLLCYVNVDIASNCFIMAMLLMVPAFQPYTADYLWRLLALVFVCTLTGQILWTCEEVFLVSNSMEQAFQVSGVALAIGLCTFAVLWLLARKLMAEGKPQLAPFVICVLISTSSVVFKLIYPLETDIPMTLDLYVFAIGSSLVFASIGCVGWFGLSQVRYGQYASYTIRKMSE